MIKIKAPFRPPAKDTEPPPDSNRRQSTFRITHLRIILLVAVGLGGFLLVSTLWRYLGFGLAPFALWASALLLALVKRPRLIPRRWNLWMGLGIIALFITGVLSYFAPEGAPLAGG